MNSRSCENLGSITVSSEHTIFQEAIHELYYSERGPAAVAPPHPLPFLCHFPLKQKLILPRVSFYQTILLKGMLWNNPFTWVNLKLLSLSYAFFIRANYFYELVFWPKGFGFGTRSLGVSSFLRRVIRHIMHFVLSKATFSILVLRLFFK